MTHVFRDHLYLLVGDADVLGDVRKLPGKLGKIARVTKNLRDISIEAVSGGGRIVDYLDLR